MRPKKMRGAFDKAEKEVMFTRNPQCKETMSFVKVSLKSFNESGGNLIEFLAPHVERSIAVIKTFMVTFIAETADGTEQPIGSGTFVKTCGFEGVLTAYHVARDLFRLPNFCLLVSETPHRLEVTPEVFGHVPVGVFPDGALPEDGPDLSFLVCRNPSFLKKLKELKDFFPLDAVKAPSQHPILKPQLWGVAGTESESCKIVDQDYMGEPLTKMTNFVGTGFLESETVRKGEFDYIRLTVPSGQFKFPYRYRGVSGGGFWLLPMEADKSGDMNTVGHTIGHRLPILAGVEFSELERDVQKRERILVGHGVDSIYKNLIQTLKENPGAAVAS